LALLEEAAAIDDRYAYLHYLRGRLLWELERYDQANTAFIRARDEDICPLRALTPMRDIIMEVAAEKHAPLIDFVAMLEQKAEHAIPGEDLFLDHAHPTIESNRQLALKLLETMTKQGIVHAVRTWDDAAIDAVRREVESRLDRRAHGIALRNLATLLKWAGKYEEAHKLALQAAQMVPKDSDTHFQLGASAARIGRLDEAMKHYQLALQLNQDHPGANTNLANILATQGKSDEAITHYRHVLRLEPNLGRVHHNLGAVLAAQGNFEEAISCYRQALKLEPDFIATYHNMGKALAAQGKFGEAIRYYRQALKLNPDYVNTHSNLARALITTGQFEQALEHCRETLRLRPDQPQTLGRMAWIIATNPDPKIRDANEATRLAERAAELTKHQDPIILSTLATVYAAAGKFEQAVTTAQTALPLAHAGKNNKLANHIKKQLNAYKQGKLAP
jgi:tetratricopeptide (TPR) repeat protein